MSATSCSALSQGSAGSVAGCDVSTENVEHSVMSSPTNEATDSEDEAAVGLGGGAGACAPCATATGRAGATAGAGGDDDPLSHPMAMKPNDQTSKPTAF